MKRILLTLLLASVSFSLTAAENFYSGASSAAIKGYAVVAYFMAGQATEGDEDFSSSIRG